MADTASTQGQGQQGQADVDQLSGRALLDRARQTDGVTVDDLDIDEVEKGLHDVTLRDRIRAQQGQQGQQGTAQR